MKNLSANNELKIRYNLFYWFVFILAIVLIVFIYCYSQNKLFSNDSHNEYPKIKLDHQILNLPPLENLQADSVLVMELNNQKVLYEKNAHLQFYPASLTKLMSAVIALENIDLNQKIFISQNAVKTEGDAGYLKAGEVFYMKDLLKMMLAMSSNDIAMALAETMGLSKFVGLMNQKASALNMVNTAFFDPTGLDKKGNFTTASDFAKLGLYIYQNYPLIAELTRTKTDNIISLNTHEKHFIITTTKIWDKIPNIWLAKTGYTPDAKECFLIIYPIGDLMFLNVILSSPDRFGDTLKIYQWLKINLTQLQ